MWRDVRLHGGDVNGSLFPTQHIPSGAAEVDGIRPYVLIRRVSFHVSSSQFAIVLMLIAPGLLSRLVVLRKTDVSCALYASAKRIDHI